MKEKVRNFYNGIFEYTQPGLKAEPPKLTFRLKAGECAQGDIIISSMDGRRVKGILCACIPGLEIKNDSFFARTSRIEYTCRARHLKAGETLKDSIWLVTDAGEYEIPVEIQTEGEAGKDENKEKMLLPAFTEYEVKPFEHKKGRGRSKEWKAKRQREAALAGLLKTVEEERRGSLSREDAARRLRALADTFMSLDKESALCPLLDAWVKLKENRQEEAGRLLARYERSRLGQQKDADIRALFLYVNCLYWKDPETVAASVANLRRIYQKQQEKGLAIWFLLELDPQLAEDPRTRYMLLERQFRAGVRNRLLYQDAWNLLKNDPALFGKLDSFTMQVFGWAGSRALLTAGNAQAVAGQATRIRKWSPLAARLLKACYLADPSKETAGAVCALYIRGGRTDEEAFSWYQRGVKLDAKITNLYEYFMYALPENYPQLLPTQVLLYFHYHNTLNSRLKTVFYCNLLRYGTPDNPIFDEHRQLLRDFLLRQLKQRRLDDSLAWLYGRCLRAETLTDDLLEALADLLFLRRLTCQDRRIRQAEIVYGQLEKKLTVSLVRGSALIPVYTPDVEIILIDEYGNRRKKTVAYELKRIMDEPEFLKICMEKLKDHLGLMLYRLDGNGARCLNEDNIELAWRFLEDGRIRESYAMRLKLEILDYERQNGGLDKLDERLRIPDSAVENLERPEQASYIEALILLEEDRTAMRLLEQAGCGLVDERLLLCLLQRQLEEGRLPAESLLPLARHVFKKGVYTENTIRFLAGQCRGNTAELLEIWKAGERFGLLLPALEEQLLVQALFTEHLVKDVFPVFQSMDSRGAEPLAGAAYLNYMGWLDFVKGKEAPDGLYESLEYHLLWEDRLCETAALSCLKHLSVLPALTDTQRGLAGKLLQGLTARRRDFSFLAPLLPCMEQKGRPADQTVIEYRCDPRHKVILYYVLEYHGKKTFDYTAECLYPACGGVFTRAFILFSGERLTWFITETAEDGTEKSTDPCVAERQDAPGADEGRFHRLCRMQDALDQGRHEEAAEMMAEYENLLELTEKNFHII